MLSLVQLEEFRPIGTDADPTARLLAPVEIAGVRHHMEAIAIVWETYEESAGEYQRAADPEWQLLFEEYLIAAGQDGAWHTVEINGREYVLCITPYCQ